MKNEMIGKEVKFTAQRISTGNPVTGILLSEDKEWITVKLTKDIEGLVNFWFTGEEKQFRKILIGKRTLTNKN